MSLKLGNNDVTKVMLGSQELSSIYKGADEVWSVGGGGNALSDVFSTYLYEGTSAARDIENGVDLAGKGGMVWFKARDQSYDHALSDTERGATKYLVANSTNQEAANANALTAFNSNGFSLGDDGQTWYFNKSGVNYVSWTWRIAPKFFDIVKYTGDSTSGREIPHNLGCEPGMVFVKRTNGSSDWPVYHKDIGASQGKLNQPANFRWNYISGASDTTFTIADSGADTNQSGGEYLAYLFAHDESDDSLIKCGSYTGNGNADGPEVDVGFEPQWLLFKNATKSEAWTIFDTARGITIGGNDEYLMPDNSGVGVSQVCLDLTPTGFKITNRNDFLNELNGQIIYMAIKADPDFFMPPEWEQMNQDVAEKLAKREAVKEAIVSKVKDSKDIKDDG